MLPPTWITTVIAGEESHHKIAFASHGPNIEGDRIVVFVAVSILRMNVNIVEARTASPVVGSFPHSPDDVIVVSIESTVGAKAESANLDRAILEAADAREAQSKDASYVDGCLNYIIAYSDKVDLACFWRAQIRSARFSSESMLAADWRDVEGEAAYFSNANGPRSQSDQSSLIVIQNLMTKVTERLIWLDHDDGCSGLAWSPDSKNLATMQPA